METSFSSLYSNISIDPLIEERTNSSDNSGDNSPSSTNFATSISSPKRSRRAIQKKIVNIPIKDLEGSKFKSDCTPPSDSWAWRKYGQKPIKGSPYPRGYYRCSSSKGCPARKQVERSRSDPTMLVVTYSYDHNHPWPTSRNHHHNRTAAATTTTTSTTLATTTDTTKLILHNNNQTTEFPQNSNNNNIIIPNMDHLSQPLMVPTDELPWVTTDHDILQNDFIFNNNYNFNDLDMAKFFPTREEDDESLFADLGELPECPVVFRRAAGDEPPNLTPWCGSTG
ncbi:hypothetical protein RND81_08G001800 [Saponaria officinalis]|uniref:WRKY domain-containing protein n=1 Tax=Saponaria officinalis TaxID=3572 RepID=A0AAW1J230_SAPOF